VVKSHLVIFSNVPLACSDDDVEPEEEEDDAANDSGSNGSGNDDNGSDDNGSDAEEDEDEEPAAKASSAKASSKSSKEERPKKRSKKSSGDSDDEEAALEAVAADEIDETLIRPRSRRQAAIAAEQINKRVRAHSHRPLYTIYSTALQLLHVRMYFEAPRFSAHSQHTPCCSVPRRAGGGQLQLRR
jgi:hypothetical protein